MIAAAVRVGSQYSYFRPAAAGVVVVVVVVVTV